MPTHYLNRLSAPLRDDGGGRIRTLLWGDPVHVAEGATATPEGLLPVRARNRAGWVEAAALGDQQLLEVYVIDIGQGDAVLLKTPDGRWHLIDAGVANRDQMTRKGTANFLRWKFQDDLCLPGVTLASVIISHPDYDHFGGLLDLLNGRLADGRTFPVEVETLYHSGIARFAAEPRLGTHLQGEVAPFPCGAHDLGQRGSFLAELVDGADTLAAPPRPFAGAFAEYAALVARVARSVRRVTRDDRYLPGYGPGESDVTVHVLGPILERWGDQCGLRRLGSDGETVNGHSICLRIDYGRARILLTGDLNRQAQRLLLSYLPADEFAADVLKACHHGAEDFDHAFLRAVQARATVISSGDDESYGHPCPATLGAAARYGRECLTPEGAVLPPLIYATELAQAIRLDYTEAVQVTGASAGQAKRTRVQPCDTHVKAKEWKKFHAMDKTPIATDLIYGLVNVRTDGEHILCATMDGTETDFELHVFRAGASAP